MLFVFFIYRRGYDNDFIIRMLYNFSY